AGDGRHGHHARDPQDAGLQGPADHRRDGQGHEGRPRALHRSRRLGLPVETGADRPDARRAALLGLALIFHQARTLQSMSFMPSDAPAPRRGSRANILVVDDHEDKLLVLQTVLEELDENVVLARSGREALKLLLEMEFAVILLDVKMPDMDGFETARLIR